MLITIYAYLWGTENWWWKEKLVMAEKDPAAGDWSFMHSGSNRVAFLNRQNNSLITGALSWRVLDLPSLSTWCFSKSHSCVNTDKLEGSGGMCCIGHAASSEKICFLSELRLMGVDVLEMVQPVEATVWSGDEKIWLIWCQVSSWVWLLSELKYFANTPSSLIPLCAIGGWTGTVTACIMRKRWSSVRVVKLCSCSHFHY